MARPRELRNRAKFDPSRDLVANRPMTLGGYQYERGAPIKREGKYAAPEKALARFWASYRIEYKEDFQPIPTADPDSDAAPEEAPAAEPEAPEAETQDAEVETPADEAQDEAADVEQATQDEDHAPEAEAEKKPAKKKGKAKKAD